MEKISTLVFRLTESDKKEFEKFSKAIGLSESAILTAFIKKVISSKRIPFEISEEDRKYAKNYDSTIENDTKKQVFESLQKLQEQVLKLQQLAEKKK